jgi:heme A synthase
VTSITPKSGLLLALCCITAIAGVGSVFELSSGEPDLGNLTTSIILAASIPLTGVLFWAAVQDTKANQK